jgi:hypothetical protein
LYKNLFEIIAAVTPSFKRTGPSVGQFRPFNYTPSARVHLDPLGWATIILPLSKHNGANSSLDPEADSLKLLELQHGIEAPVKIIFHRGLNRYALVGEIPPLDSKDPGESVKTCNIVKQGFKNGIFIYRNYSKGKKCIWGRESQRIQDTNKNHTEIIQERLVDIFEQIGGGNWTKTDDGILIGFDTENYFQKIEVQLKRTGTVGITSLLTSYNDESLSIESRAALARFLLEVNCKIRLTRASIVRMMDLPGHQTGQPDPRMKAVNLEVLLGGDVLSACFLEKAIASLVVAARYACLEVRALMNEEVARAYLKINGEAIQTG